jgi:AcrR family transcriptional regulator
VPLARDGKSQFTSFRLPPGRHGLAPELVSENQRLRLLGACAEVIAELGYGATTTARVSRAAGVSSRSFYRHFDDLDGCVEATYETAAAGFSEAVSSACGEQGQSREPLEAGIAAALEFSMAEPALARVLGTAVSGLPAVAAARERLLGRLTELLPESRGERRTVVPPRIYERARIGGALGLVSARLERGDRHIAGLAPELVELLSDGRC